MFLFSVEKEKRVHLPYYTEIYILRTADMRSAQVFKKCTPAEKAAYVPDKGAKIYVLIRPNFVPDLFWDSNG